MIVLRAAVVCGQALSRWPGPRPPESTRMNTPKARSQPAKPLGLTFADVRALASALPGVEDGTSYGPVLDILETKKAPLDGSPHPAVGVRSAAAWAGRTLRNPYLSQDTSWRIGRAPTGRPGELRGATAIDCTGGAPSATGCDARSNPLLAYAKP